MSPIDATSSGPVLSFPRYSGHYWTIRAGVQHALQRAVPLQDETWTAPLEDDKRPGLQLTGQIRRTGAGTAVVLVHGLGGSSDSPYVRRAAARCAAMGWDYLRPNLRGADFGGADFYHAGLSTDLQRCVEAFSGYDRIFMVGFSLGGHLTMHYALSFPSTLTAVAVVGAPLSLDASASAFDRRRVMLYREAVLLSLKRAYRAYASFHANVAAYREIARVRTIREWDRRVVVPRFGFRDVGDYYASMSVAPRLHALETPTLYVGAEGDPMVPRWTVAPYLRGIDAIEVHMLPYGGHVAFPPRLAVRGPAGALEHHLLEWLGARPARRSTLPNATL